MENSKYGLGIPTTNLFTSSLGVNTVGKNLFRDDNSWKMKNLTPYPSVNTTVNNLLNGGINYGNAQVVKVIHNNPKTIVFWSDKTKTIVSCSEDAVFDEYSGFCAAFVKKMFGSNTRVKKIMKAKTVISKKEVNNGKI